MTITTDDVRYVARLARLRLDDADVEQMTGELAAILGHVGRVGELELADVEPTTHVVDVANVLGADEVRASVSHEDALRNAPDPTDSQFGVPRMRS